MRELLEALRRVEREGKLKPDWQNLQVQHTDGGNLAVKVPVQWLQRKEQQKTMEYLSGFLKTEKKQHVASEVENDLTSGQQHHFILIQHQTTATRIPAALALLRTYGIIVKESKTELADASAQLNADTLDQTRRRGGQQVFISENGLAPFDRIEQKKNWTQLNMTNRKPTIVNVIQTELEERAPPDESEYEFVETWPKKTTELKNQPTGVHHEKCD